MGDVVRVVGAGVLIVVLTGCSLVGDALGPRPQATVTVTRPPEPPASTAAAPVETVEPPGEQQSGPLPADVGAYADAFVRAWGIGDYPDAARYATAGAVDSLFRFDGRGGSTWKRHSSIGQGPRTQVRYTDGTGQSLYVVVDTAAADGGLPGAVVGANVEWDDTDDVYSGDPNWWVPPDSSGAGTTATGLPSTTGEYADALIRAWGVGDRAAADDYATGGAMATLFDGYGAGGSGWRRTATTTSSATYSNRDGGTLTVHLDATTVSAGRGDAVSSATFS